MTNDQLKELHKEVCKELSDIKTVYMAMGVMIADMRGQIDTIFEKQGIVLHNPVTCDYQGLFKNIKTHKDRGIFEGLERLPDCCGKTTYATQEDAQAAADRLNGGEFSV